MFGSSKWGRSNAINKGGCSGCRLRNAAVKCASGTIDARRTSILQHFTFTFWYYHIATMRKVSAVLVMNPTVTANRVEISETRLWCWPERWEPKVCRLCSYLGWVASMDGHGRPTLIDKVTLVPGTHSGASNTTDLVSRWVYNGSIKQTFWNMRNNDDIHLSELFKLFR